MASNASLVDQFLTGKKAAPIDSLTQLRVMFYLVTPDDSVPNNDMKPSYVTNAFPFFAAFMLLEQVVLYAQGKRLYRVNDSVMNICAGLFSELTKMLVRSVSLASYTWLHSQCSLLHLPWDSAAAWWLAMIGVDFAFYCGHRMTHEVNVLWVGHQMHHSSEEYNLSTALRQGLFQNHLTWFWYTPLALFIPPPVFLLHQDFNLLYQFWVHTETVGKLGVLEWVLNTPSHHRVHHGRNRYCIDRNYGGVLIIWDRLFGTFQEELPGKQLAYGLVHPLQSWDPLSAQFGHLRHVYSQLQSRSGFVIKLKTLFYGPGWTPGAPRLGWREEIPLVHFPYARLNHSVRRWCGGYVMLHLTLVILLQLLLANAVTNHAMYMVQLCTAGLIVLSFKSFACLFDRRWYAPFVELVRCTLLGLGCCLCSPVSFLQESFWLQAALAAYVSSALIWFCAACGCIDWAGADEPLIVEAKVKRK